MKPPRHGREEILSVMESVDCAAVSTLSGENIRSRMMHYWNDEDFNIYLATMKGDPKTLQITENSSVSLLILKRDADINDSREIEVTGRAFILKDEAEAYRAFKELSKKSPVVKYLMDTGNLDMLDCIKIVPLTVKYRIFREIVEGQPPTVIEFPGNRLGESEFYRLKRKIHHWIMELRAPFLTASIIPIILGTIIALTRNLTFNLEYFILALLAGVLLHLGTNVINDYFDYRSGNDELNREFVRPFSGGSRTIQLGLLTPLEVLSGALLLYILGVSIGLYLTFTRGVMILVLGLIGLVSGFFYTAPPINWAGRGIGEFLVGLNFGTLMTLGAYYVQTGTLGVEPLLASLPISFLVAAVLYINEFPDFNADRMVGKNTLVVRLGRDRAVYGYVLLMAGSFLSLVLAIVAGVLPTYTIIALITLPLALKAVRCALKNYSSPFDLAPANALTILCHLSTGLLMCFAYLMEWFGAGNMPPLLIFGGMIAAFTIYMYRHIERQKRVFLGLKRSMQAG